MAMEYRKLGQTNQKVSVVCLGTMTWGEQNSEKEGHEQMDYAISRGINFFDAAELYPIPPKAETQGRTEEIIGTWFKKNGTRNKVVLATKVVGRSQMPWFRGEETRLNKKHIEKALEDSLKRLQTDYIDLYQLHWPDRKMNIFDNNHSYSHIKAEAVAIHETLEVLNECVKQGKVRYVGISNESAWGVAEYIKSAEYHDLPRVASIQNAYNLLNRTFEQMLSEFYYRSSVGLLAYSPLAGGFLSGKYLNGARPKGARDTLFNRGQRYKTEYAEGAIDAYVKYAKERGIDPSTLAHAFVFSREFVTSSIVGATKLEQLKLAIDSSEVKLSEEDLNAIEKIHNRRPNPCP